VTGARPVRLYALSRALPAAELAIALCAVGLRVALLRHWDDDGALHLALCSRRPRRWVWRPPWRAPSASRGG
jgi:hypothetical protein